MFSQISRWPSCPRPRPSQGSRRRPASGRLKTLAVAAGLWLLHLGVHAADITVSAAASLNNALRDVAPLFEEAHPAHKLRFNFGASGALLAQMARGAPVDVFISADQETMDQAQAQGLVRAAQRRNVASNTLVVVVPAAGDSPSKPSNPSNRSNPSKSLAVPQPPSPPKTLNDLARPAVARIAIGLPASVPAGRYAQSALEAAGLWAAIAPKVIGAHHVRQALDYVARAEVDAGFVYATDAALVPGKVQVVFTVPTAQPILYPAAPVVAGPHAADGVKFVDFLLMPTAQAVLAKHGFGRP
jgi:molybdate transport system substrate-binding protein